MKPKPTLWHDPLAVSLAMDPGDEPVRRRKPVTRSIGFLMGVIGVIGLLLGLVRYWQTLVGALAVGVLGLIVLGFLVFPWYVSRTIVLSLRSHGDAVSASDRIAAFLCVALFTTPICFILFWAAMLFLSIFLWGMD